MLKKDSGWNHWSWSHAHLKKKPKTITHDQWWESAEWVMDGCSVLTLPIQLAKRPVPIQLWCQRHSNTLLFGLPLLQQRTRLVIWCCSLSGFTPTCTSLPSNLSFLHLRVFAAQPDGDILPHETDLWHSWHSQSNSTWRHLLTYRTVKWFTESHLIW